MHGSRPVAPAEPASDPLVPAAGISDGGASAVRRLAAAAEIGPFRAVTRSAPVQAGGLARIGRIDLSRMTAVPPSHRLALSAATAGRAANQAGGAMGSPDASPVAPPDGTCISLGGWKKFRCSKTRKP